MSKSESRTNSTSAGRARRSLGAPSVSGPLESASTSGGLTGRIVNIAFLGNYTRITLTTAAGDVVTVRPHGTSVMDGGVQPELGEEVCVWWQPDHASLIAD